MIKCWNCEKGIMEQQIGVGLGWFQCSNCKATTSTKEIKPKKKGKNVNRN